jgi:EmrB/QacA subfamily drug resistance transporter
MHGFHSKTKTNGTTAPWRLLWVLLVAQLMVILDITAVNIALPHLAHDLGIGGSSISWAITSYSLVFGSLLLLGGRSADLLGRKRVFLTGLSVFTFASLASALATSAAALFAGRAGQGLGAALLSPAALSIVNSSFHGKDRAKALAAWGAVGGAGAAIGVLAGGVLTELASWRTIFFVNMPVAVVLAALAVRYIPADGEQPRWRGLDIRGAAIGVASLASIVYSIARAGEVGWTSTATLAFGFAGLFGLILFAVAERRAATPLLEVERLLDKATGGGLAVMLAGTSLLFGLFLLSSLYLQNVLGTGPLDTGLAFVPLALAAGAGAHVAGHTVSRHGIRVPLAIAFAISAAGLVLLSRVGAHGSYVADVLPGMLVAGFGLGIVVVSIGIGVMAGARSDEAGMISGLSATGHEIGGTIGIAMFTSIAASASGLSAAGIGHAFLIGAHVAIAAALVALFALPSARAFLPKLRLSPEAMLAH